MYVITHTNGNTFTTLGEGVLNNSLGISLIGQNYHNYGQLIANNFLQMLEHQASDTAPNSPIAGQLWWDSGNKVLKCFDGTKFKPCSSSTVGTASPVQPLSGDQWWDTNTNQLKAWTGTEWIVVGPHYSKGQGFTGMRSTTIYDTLGNAHVVSTVEVDGTIVGMASKDPTFTPSSQLGGITIMNRGINLAANTTLTGTASNSAALGGYLANVFVKTSDASTTLLGSLTVQGLSGVMLNDADTFKAFHNLNGVQLQSANSDITLSSGNVSVALSGDDGTLTSLTIPTRPASITNKLYVDTLVSTTDAALRNYVDSTLGITISDSPIPTLKELSAAINNDKYYHVNVTGLLNLKANIASPTFTGAPRAPTVASSDSSTAIATTAFVQTAVTNITHLGIIDGLTTSGNIMPTTDNTIDIGSTTKKFKNLYGTSMSAVYGDLAEKYKADAKYMPGTVLVFGGKHEVTTSDQYCDHRIAGVVSTKPGYLMNDKEVSDSAVALTGKVPCKVVGAVKKGDILVNSEFTGVAKVLASAGHWKPGCVIGKSMEDNAETGIRNVMISVGRF